MGKNSLRGRVIERWKEEGCPQWDYETTKKVCLEEDQTFAEKGDNPAPGFREKARMKDESDVRKWVLGCYFPWLNPRKPTRNTEQLKTPVTDREGNNLGGEIPNHATLPVTDSFFLAGSVPDDILKELREAIQTVPKSCFFNADGSPSSKEVKGLDRTVAEYLRRKGRRVKEDLCPFSDSNFNCDIAIADLGLLVEIEKGKYPRLELDILKIASASIRQPDRWKYGLLIVPSTHIELPLEGRQSPVKYLRRLSPLVKPVVEGTALVGIGVLGYGDPR